MTGTVYGFADSGLVMKIDQINQVIGVNQSHGLNRAGASRTAGPESSGSAVSSTVTATNDTLKISSRAEVLARLASKVASLPDIRQDRVENLRQSATSGAFNPTGSDIAAAIMNDEGRSA
ncbi:MAG TPA: flagellar biosynthesis anti-sigma factor FlgM [Blastocatellia bacterium]|nr:flagellar biosynthesis anti-sigma factor FlgM [Blastocatellia bacterium]